MSQATAPTRPGMPPATPPRPLARRKADILRLLTTDNHLWLASAADDQAHMVPLAFAWDGSQLIMMTRRQSRTVTNLRRRGHARAALGSTRDVVIVDGSVTFSEPGDASAEVRELFARLPLNPERVPGVIAVHLVPERILAWRGMSEMAERTVMAEGRWLV
jgi:hypothetical protein